MQHIADIRKEYIFQTLSEHEVAGKPIDQFETWWKQALESDIEEVNAMTLATVGANGRPSARIVLLKGFDENGFVFFTNYQSHKGNDIQINPYVSVVFFWKELERQVRINGIAEKIDEKESDIYFQSRPEASKIGAWASPQSNVIENREVIENNEAGYQAKFAGNKIERPPHWGGYIVKPEVVEFWQGRASRLHDRIRYTIETDNNWKIERLAP